MANLLRLLICILMPLRKMLGGTGMEGTVTPDLKYCAGSYLE
jgi:hypothetical protein